MEAVKLTALRDFAIAPLPRAQATSRQTHTSQDAYHVALSGAAVLALASPTASAVERAAALLLQHVTGLSVIWDTPLTPRQRHELDHQAIAAATDLCTLTHTSLPWLADAMTHESPPPTPAPEPAPQLTSRRPAPPPGINLKTAEAAEYLNVNVQTMHKWSSTDSGPLRPTRSRSRLHWSSDDVLRIMQGK